MKSSGGSGPKRHHFVPELLLKRFTDPDGRIFFFDHDRPELGVRRSTPKQLFNETDLYTEIGRDGVKDVSLERAFSALETRIEPLIERAVNAARANQTPRFSNSEKRDWDKFLLWQWKRVPDLHKSVPMLRGIEQEIDQLLCQLSQIAPDLNHKVNTLRQPDTM